MESGNFSSSTSSSLITQFQTQNFKRQIDLLQQKLDINEKEYQNKIISLTDQISLLNSTEVKLRNQLSNKDKALYELNNILKEYQTEVINLKKELCLKDEKLISVTNDFNSIKSNCNSISIALTTREESNGKIEKAYKELLAEQGRSEKKLKELIEVMNQYSVELNKLHEKCNKLERENFDFKTLNMNLTSELKKATYNNQNYEQSLHSLTNDINNYQRMNENLNDLNIKLKQEMETYSKDIYDTNQKMKDILKDNEHLKNVIDNLKNEKSQLESDLTTNMKINQRNLEKFGQSETEINNIIDEANDNIKLISSWLENYMGVYYPSNVKIPEIPLRTGKNKTIQFELLKQKIQIIREKVNSELINTQKYKNKITTDIGNINKKSDYIQKKVKEMLNNVIFEIQKNNYFDVQNQNESSDDSNILKLQDYISQLLNFVYQDKLTRSNTNNQIECLKRESNNYKSKCELLQKQNDEISKKLLSLDKISKEYDTNIQYKANYEKVKEEYNLLDKKYKNLITESELKQLQIKSLEDIVARRNTGNNNGCSIPEHSTKIKQLEIDKDNLIKDNMLLINENKSLKQRISNSSNITIKQ